MPRPVAGECAFDLIVTAAFERIVDGVGPAGVHFPGVQGLAQDELRGARVDHRQQFFALERRPAATCAFLQQAQAHHQADGQQVNDIGGIALRPVVMLCRGSPANEAGPAIEPRQLPREITRPVLVGNPQGLHDVDHGALRVAHLIEDLADMHAPQEQARIAAGDLAPGVEETALAARHGP